MVELSQAEEAVFDGIDFVKITTSPFRFGSSSDSPYATHFENQILIDIDHEFWISKYEITQAQWIDIVGSNPSIISDSDDLGRIPVNSISWYEAKEFINLLNQRSDNYYRLPTEVEWEYVARANSTTEWSFGDDPSNISAYVWMNDPKPRNIGLTLPNSFGVYDMYGNAYEWVEDSYELVKDPDQGACPSTDGTLRVLRGGSNGSALKFLRSSNRNFAKPQTKHWSIGLRLVRVVSIENDIMAINGICSRQPLCGNGVVDVGEECDDGNTEIENCAYNEDSCMICGNTCSFQNGNNIKLTYSFSGHIVDHSGRISNLTGGNIEDGTSFNGNFVLDKTQAGQILSSGNKYTYGHLNLTIGSETINYFNGSMVVDDNGSFIGDRVDTDFGDGSLFGLSFRHGRVRLRDGANLALDSNSIIFTDQLNRWSTNELRIYANGIDIIGEITYLQRSSVYSGSESCGDSVLNGSESCDDGNLVNGDGCDSQCVVE
jgi:cysteine-rich repeat protein